MMIKKELLSVLAVVLFAQSNCSETTIRPAIASTGKNVVPYVCSAGISGLSAYTLTQLWPSHPKKVALLGLGVTGLGVAFKTARHVAPETFMSLATKFGSTLAKQDSLEKIPLFAISTGLGITLAGAYLWSNTPAIRNNPLDEDLIKACNNWNIDNARELLDKGANANATEKAYQSGATPLHYVCESLDSPEELVRLLDEALIKACNNWDINNARELLDKGANANATEKAYQSGATPLHYVCESLDSPEELVRLLLERGADPNITTKNGNTPLHYAAFSKHPQSVALLLKSTKNINKANNNGDTPLHNACFAVHNQIKVINPDIIESFIAHRADLDVANTLTGNTPLLLALHASCHNNSPENGLKTVKLLLESGADVNKADNDGTTPLHLACRYGYKKIIKQLLNKGAKVNRTDKYGRTPLHYVCESNREIDEIIITLLLKNGADVRITDNAKQTPLYIACNTHSTPNLAIIDLLLKNGSPVDTVDLHNQTTPFEQAAIRWSHKRETMSKIAELLFIHNALDINKQYRCYDRTPLHYMCFSACAKTVELALQKANDINIADDKGSTPLHIACESNNQDVVKLLLAKGADVNKACQYGTTALHIACRNNNPEIVKLLLAQSANTNTTNQRGETPLDIACNFNRREIIELLLAKSTQNLPIGNFD